MQNPHTSIGKLAGAIFISGRGSNMEQLLRQASKVEYPVRFRLILADREAAGLEIARQITGFPIIRCDPHKDAALRQSACSYDDGCIVLLPRRLYRKPAFELTINYYLQKYAIKLICLAGFMSILSSGFVARWKNRVLNIHPSLLPAYRGLNTHQRALADGVKLHGCSVHLVTSKVDQGRVLAQAQLAVSAADTADTLAQRVLSLEHKIYSKIVAAYAQSDLTAVDKTSRQS